MANRYTGRNGGVKRYVAVGATFLGIESHKLEAMEYLEKYPHFMRAWRESRKLSLRELANLMHDLPKEAGVSYASLSRVETYKQPYNQLMLNGIAEILRVEPWMLLRLDPEKNIQIINMYNALPEEKKAQAIKLFEF
jgi:transcriptional regulator with XRE-family HTH domain